MNYRVEPLHKEDDQVSGDAERVERNGCVKVCGRAASRAIPKTRLFLLCSAFERAFGGSSTYIVMIECQSVERGENWKAVKG